MARVAGFFANFQHCNHDAGDLWVLAQGFRDWGPRFYVGRGGGKHFLVGDVTDDVGRYLETMEHLDAALQHCGKVVGYARKKELFVDAADDRDLHSRARVRLAPRRRHPESHEKDPASDKKNAQEKEVG